MSATVTARPARRPFLRAALALSALLLGVLATGASATRAPKNLEPAPVPGALPRLGISANYVTGISSGGYMATQLQVAHSSRFSGAGIYSAGPYYCAQNSLAVALADCLPDYVPGQLPTYIAKTDEYAAAGKIDPVSGLARHRTWLFHGTKDPTVAEAVSDELAAYYRHYGTPLTYRRTVAAGHGWVSPAGPVACADTVAPFINTCSPDPLHDMLTTVLGAVRAPNTKALKGRVTVVDQDRYAVPAAPGAGNPTRTGAEAIGMGRTGYLYTPPSCTTGTCRLVVALHGCKQTAEQIGRTFVDRSYLNEYADTNGLVVLYPQARPDEAFGNPNGCWDWWGYLGPADGDYATKNGPQMRTVMNMVAALGG
jgi:poly(3-hydroxybutyrate) depolymerase